MALIRNIDPLKVVVFGSSYHGVAVAGKILELEKRYPGRARLTAVVTNPSEQGKVAAMAIEHNVPLRREDVSTALFRDTLIEEWRPDICYRVGFKQSIPQTIIDFPRLGFYSFTPTAMPVWPPNAPRGDDPFQSLLARKATEASLALHQVGEEDGHGDLVGFSKSFAVASNDDALALGRNSADMVAQMVEGQLSEYIGLPRQDYAAMGFATEPRFLKRA